MKKNAKATRLLFRDGFAIGYSAAIPESFAEAIYKEELSEGDVFFSNRSGYDSCWADAIKCLEWVVQIRESMTGGKTVLFEVMRTNSRQRHLESVGIFKLHWDDFLDRLKTGDFENLAHPIEPLDSYAS